MDLRQVCEAFHKRLVDMRSIYRFITSDRFKHIWESCNSETKTNLLEAIQHNNREHIKTIIEVMVKDLGEMGVRELKDLARRRGIRGFATMHKATLLSELSKLEGLDYEED